jgi:hypothetical protein
MIVFSPSLLSSCGLSLPATCLVLTVKEARSYFASTIFTVFHLRRNSNYYTQSPYSRTKRQTQRKYWIVAAIFCCSWCVLEIRTAVTQVFIDRWALATDKYTLFPEIMLQFDVAYCCLTWHLVVRIRNADVREWTWVLLLNVRTCTTFAQLAWASA